MGQVLVGRGEAVEADREVDAHQGLIFYRKLIFTVSLKRT